MNALYLLPSVRSDELSGVCRYDLQSESLRWAQRVQRTGRLGAELGYLGLVGTIPPALKIAFRTLLSLCYANARESEHQAVKTLYRSTNMNRQGFPWPSSSLRYVEQPNGQTMFTFCLKSLLSGPFSRGMPLQPVLLFSYGDIPEQPATKGIPRLR